MAPLFIVFLILAVVLLGVGGLFFILCKRAKNAILKIISLVIALVSFALLVTLIWIFWFSDKSHPSQFVGNYAEISHTYDLSMMLQSNGEIQINFPNCGQNISGTWETWAGDLNTILELELNNHSYTQATISNDTIYLRHIQIGTCNLNDLVFVKETEKP